LENDKKVKRIKRGQTPFPNKTPKKQKGDRPLFRREKRGQSKKGTDPLFGPLFVFLKIKAAFPGKENKKGDRPLFGPLFQKRQTKRGQNIKRGRKNNKKGTDPFSSRTKRGQTPFNEKRGQTPFRTQEKRGQTPFKVKRGQTPFSKTKKGTDPFSAPFSRRTA
jgi:hypothetical protein